MLKKFWCALYILCCLGAVVFPPLVAATMLSAAPTWLINLLYAASMVGYSFLGLAFPLTIVFLFISIPLAMSTKHRSNIARCWGLIILLIGALVLGLGTSRAIQRTRFLELAERSAPVIQAISKYQQERRRPPSELQELVPDYLRAVPSTGFAIYPSYGYQLNPVESVPWELKVDCPQGPLNWDVFFYWPSKKYPANIYGGYVEPIADWAYVHE